MESRIDCINIPKPNCEFYCEGRLCPDDCKGFIKKESLIIPVVIEKSIEPVVKEKVK